MLCCIEVTTAAKSSACLMCRWMSRSRVNLAPADDASVKHVKAESQHLSAESLDECFDVFTQQERVSDVQSLRTVHRVHLKLSSCHS